MSPRKAENTPQKQFTLPVKEGKRSPRWSEYFRFGESYTSLILGIIVVIVTTILLVFLVKDRSSTPLNGNPSKSISSTSTTLVTPTDIVLPSGATFALTPEPTDRNINRPTVTPTTAAVTVTTMPSITKTPLPTRPVTPTKVVVQKNNPIAPSAQKGGKSYTVASGDNLWAIAEKFYQSGYNWVDIASANKLSNPGVITAGTRLTIPDVPVKVATMQTTSEVQNTAYGPKISGNTYKVQKGDHLWGIAVRAYNNGYQWSQIAKENNITTPNIIHVGTVLKLPRVTAAVLQKK